MAIKTTSTRKVTNSSTLSSAYSATATITQVVITDSNYDALDDTTVSSAGGYIKILGLGFMSGYSLYYNGVAIATSTLVSSNEIRAVIPSIANGTYNLTLFNSNNTGALYVLTASGFPTWTTGTYTNQTGVVSVQLLVTGDAPLTYSLQAGSSLPNGVTLSSSGLLSGTLVGVSSNATYTFVVLVNDVQNQTTQETITLNVVFADPQFNYTTLLLNGETTVTPFINDASTNNFGLTINGDTKPVLFNPYTPGYYSNYFDGTGDYLSAPANAAFNFGTGDFTIECWIYSLANQVQFAGVLCNLNTTDGFYFSFSNGSNNMGFSNYATYYINPSSVTIVNNVWTHVAVTRSGTTLRMFFNGSIVGTATNNTAVLGSSTNGTAVGYNGASHYFNGYVSDVRIVKGTAVYTSAFTPPTTPLTAISGTSLLTCQSNRLIDNSTNNFTITKNGDVAVSPNIPFTQNSSYSTYGSTYFDGTGDYLSIASNPAHNNFGTSDFGVEGWFYFNNITGTQLIFSHRNSSAGAAAYVPFLLWLASGTITVYVSSDNGSWNVVNGSTAGTVAAGQWYHIAYTRTGNTFRVFVNGVQTLTFTSSASFNCSQPFQVGMTGPGETNSAMNGYVSNVRMVKGTAVYTSDFVPPQTPLTAIANTSLLTCQYNGGANNSGIIDNSNFNNIITRNGNTSQGTFSPYSVTGWSNYFDGTGDYLVISSATAFDQDTDFTIEMWINITNYPGSNDAKMYQTDGSGSLAIALSTAGKINIDDQVTGNKIVSVLTLAKGVWYHLALVRNGPSTNNLKLYIDGSVDTTVSYSNWQNSPTQVTIGRRTDTNTDYTGYISNLRVVKGTAVYTANFTPPTTPLTAISGTTLLTCQSNRLIDNSPNTFTLTKAGDVSVQAFDPFGSVPEAVPISYSVYFDGTGDYLTTTTSANLALQSNDFTVELWYYPTGRVQSYPVLISNGNFGSQKWQINDRHSSSPTKVSVNLHAGSSGDGWLVSTTTISVNTWYHVALVRSGSTFTLYINGVGEQSKTLSGSITAATDFITLGQDQNQGVTCYTGYISNARIVNGTAVYTSNFTPSTTPLTAIANTSLLTCQSTTMIDNSTNRFTITAVGNTVPRIFNPFGYTAQTATSYTPSLHGGSIYLDGTGDYLVCPAIANVSGTGYSWTVQGWFYPLSIASGGIIDGWNGGVGSSLLIRISSGTLQGFVTGGSSTSSAASSIITNQWYHFALVKNVDNSNTVQLYLNGVKVGTPIANYTSSITSNIFGIGGNTSTGGEGVTGYLSDIQIIKGIALYTNNFIPPTSSLTPTTNTSLLLNFNNGGIIDQHGTNVLETVGNAQLSTAVKKYNNGSMYFDGTGDYLVAPANPSFDLSICDFTVELWMYLPVTNTYKGIWGVGVAGGKVGLGLQSSNNGTITLVYGNGSSTSFTTGTTVVQLGTWNHLAVSRSGSTTRFYINGILDSTTTASTFGSGSYSCYVGDGWGISSGNLTNGAPITGYIEDFRITKGFARYTANFTAPTAGLVGQ